MRFGKQSEFSPVFTRKKRLFRSLLKVSQDNASFRENVNWAGVS
jgi:hypothetical protein